MSESHVFAVKSLYAAFGRGDVPGILAHLDADVVWDADGSSWGMPWYEPLRGRDSVPSFFARLTEHTVIHKFAPQNFLTGGNQVAVPIDLEIEILRSGRRVVDLEVHLFTFGANGLITRFAHVLDRHPQVCAWRGIEP